MWRQWNLYQLLWLLLLTRHQVDTSHINVNVRDHDTCLWSWDWPLPRLVAWSWEICQDSRSSWQCLMSSPLENKQECNSFKFNDTCVDEMMRHLHPGGNTSTVKSMIGSGLKRICQSVSQSKILELWWSPPLNLVYQISVQSGPSIIQVLISARWLQAHRHRYTSVSCRVLQFLHWCILGTIFGEGAFAY